MATAINDFIQGIIMLAGIVAGHCRSAERSGRIHEPPYRRWAQIESDVAVTQGQPGAFTSFFGPDPSESSGSRHPDVPGNLGASADDRKILRDKR